MTLPAMICSSAAKGEDSSGAHDDPAPGQALGQIVVGVADEPQRHPRGTKAPKLWPAEPRKVSTMLSSGSPAPPWRVVIS